MFLLEVCSAEKFWCVDNAGNSVPPCPPMCGQIYLVEIIALPPGSIYGG